MDLNKNLLNIFDASKKTVQAKAKANQIEAKKQLGVLSDVADTSASTTKAIAQKKAFPLWFGAVDKIQNLANIPKMTVDSSPFKFDNLLGQSQGWMPNLWFTTMWTQRVEPTPFTPSMPSITQDAQMIRDDAVSRMWTVDDKVLKIMDTYNIDRNELFDLWKFTRQRLEEAGEDTTGLDDVDIAEYALDTAPEEEKQQYMRGWVLGTIQWAFQEWAEKQAQARARTDVWMQSWLEWFTQAASATPWVVSDLLWDVTTPIISKAWELWQELGAELGNIIRPLVWKEMLDDTEKEARIQELNQRAAQQWGNAIVPLMKEYAKLDTRTQKNLESLLPYIDLWVWVWWSVRAWEQIAKTGIKEWIETWLKKWATMISEAIPSPSWITQDIWDSLRKSSIASVERALNPTTKRAKQLTQKIAPWVIERNMVWSLEDLWEQAQKGMEDFWSKIGEYIDANGIKWEIDTNKLTKIFDDINIDYNPQWKVVNPQVQNITDWFKNILKQYGNKIDWEDAKLLMKAWDNVVYSTKWWIQTEDLALSNQFRKKGADVIRSELAKSNPDLAKLNKEYSFFSNLKEVIDATAMRKTGQVWWLERMATVIWAAWWLSSGWLISALWSWLAMKYFIWLVRSPYWNTLSASIKNKIANMISTKSKDVWSEIISIAKQWKVYPVSDEVVNKVMKTSLVPVKEWALESRWYTQKLVSSKRDITEINPTAWKTYTARDVLEEVRAKKAKSNVSSKIDTIKANQAKGVPTNIDKSEPL